MASTNIKIRNSISVTRNVTGDSFTDSHSERLKDFNPNAGLNDVEFTEAYNLYNNTITIPSENVDWHNLIVGTYIDGTAIEGNAYVFRLWVEVSEGSFMVGTDGEDENIYSKIVVQKSLPLAITPLAPHIENVRGRGLWITSSILTIKVFAVVDALSYSRPGIDDLI